MKAVIILLSFTIFSLAFGQNINTSKIIDLSYPYDEHTIFWPTEAGFKLEVQFNGMTEKGYHYSANKFCTAEHGGTHLDAPIHFFESGLPVDQIPLEKLIGSAAVIDVSQKCEADRDYLINIDDFLSWEKINGELNEGIIVLLKTGFGKFWPDREKYMGTAERGSEAVAKLHFPGLHPDAAKWLSKVRKIKAIGIDTPSIDYGQSTHFETHIILGENSIPIMENVANLDLLPEKNFDLIALPMKIKGGSGGPTRIVALVYE